MIGSLLNQYRLDEVVGQGGMGVVYRALDTNLERTVAVKVLSAAVREDADFVARFRQEARTQAALNHPNIATLFDFFVWNETPVAVMEFIEGESLRTLVDRNGPIPAHIALTMIVQALRGVAAGHRRGIIHRDLKPSNLMITAEGTVKITDFGIAKVRGTTSQTRVSTRIGSPSYMAPEQILGRPVDERTDIYVLGGTLYELLSGRPPFQGLSQFEIDSGHVRDQPKLPTEYCANIPPKAVDAVMRSLAKEPAERFATAEEFIEALPDLHGVPYIAPPPPEPVASVETQLLQNRAPSLNARRKVVTVVVSGLLVFGVIGILLLWTRHARVGVNQPIAPQPAKATDPPTVLADAPSPATIVDLPAATAATLSLTGTWTGTYVDQSGSTLLQLLDMHLQQAPDGDITGRFIYKAGSSAAEECTLEKSSYSAQSKRLRLITHCRNPARPKYFNVPLEFDDVNPDASSIRGGRLAFHLADDIVVNLVRSAGN